MKEIGYFIKEIKETHKDILKILELSPSALQKKIKNWTVKDAIAHIISWRKEEMEIVKKAVKEKKPEWNYFLKTQKDLDKWNEKEISKRKDKTPKELKQELENILREWLSLLENMDEKILGKEFQTPWEGKTTVREYIEVEIEHTKGHLERIKNTLRNF